ncbi:MAG: hypothetical protein ACXWFX_13285 [Methylobacter sp.]
MAEKIIKPENQVAADECDKEKRAVADCAAHIGMLYGRPRLSAAAKPITGKLEHQPNRQPDCKNDRYQPLVTDF